MNEQQRLYDAILRLNLLMDGLRQRNLFEIEKLTDDLSRKLREKIEAAGNPAELTKKEQAELIVALRKIVNDFEQKHQRQVERFATEFARLTADIQGEVLKELTGTDYALAAAALAALLAAFWRDALPGVGASPPVMIRTAYASLVVAVGNMVRRAPLEKWDARTLVLNTVGTFSTRHRGSPTGALLNNLLSIITTILTGLAAALWVGIGKEATDEYQWISVMDAATTEICQSRHRNIYRWGEGPVPPAHYGCRSDILPLLSRAPVPVETFAKWAARQPEAVRIAFFGGAGVPPDRARFRRSLTLTQYRDLLPLLTAS